MSTVWIGLLGCVCVCLRVTAQQQGWAYMPGTRPPHHRDDDQTKEEVRSHLKVVGLRNSGMFCVYTIPVKSF